MATTTVAPDGWIYLHPPGWFDGFRKFFFPAIYPELRSHVEGDITEAGFIFAGVILLFSLVILLPGFRCREMISIVTRIFLGVFITTAIMVCNFSQEWEVAHITTRTQYRAGLIGEINASVGVMIGLRGVNFTLRGDPVVQQFNKGLVNETVDYNEQLNWDSHGFLVGRGGFGPFAGKFNREFREHQRKGSPYPILWSAEYFTLDGEGVRWGRHYLQAGYYTSIVIWSALPCWWLSMILFNMVTVYGALFSIMTGACMIAGNVIYFTQRNPFPLKIPFEDAVLTFTWGWAFWLCLFLGLLTIVIGVVVIVLDYCIPTSLSEFFGIDFTQDLEEFYIEESMDSELTEDVVEVKPRWGSRRRRTIILPKSMAASEATLVDNEEIDTGEGHAPSYQRQPSNDMLRGYRRQTIFPGSRKIMKQTSVPGSPPVSQPEVVYANTVNHDNAIYANSRISEEQEDYVDVPIDSDDIELEARTPKSASRNEDDNKDIFKDEDM